MPFWDVGTTNKLVGAPASYDQSALTDMQSWLDAEAKRKRDEAEKRRLQAIEDRKGELIAQGMADEQRAADEYLSNVNLGNYRVAVGDGKEDQSIIEKIRANPRGVVDPTTGQFFESGPIEMKASLRKKSKRTREEADAREASQAAEALSATLKAQNAKSKMALDQAVLDGSITREQADAMVAATEADNEAQVAALATQYASGITDPAKRGSFGKIIDTIASTFGEKKKQQKYNDSWAKMREVRKGLDLQQAEGDLEDQMSKISGIDYGSPDVADVRRRALSPTFAELSKLDPSWKPSESFLERGLTRDLNASDKVDLAERKRVSSQDRDRTSILNNSMTQYMQAARQADAVGKELRAIEDELAKIRLQNAGKLAVAKENTNSDALVARSKMLTAQLQTAAKMKMTAGQNIANVMAMTGDQRAAEFIKNAQRLEPLQDPLKVYGIGENFANQSLVPGSVYGMPTESKEELPQEPEGNLAKIARELRGGEAPKPVSVDKKDIKEQGGSKKPKKSGKTKTVNGVVYINAGTTSSGTTIWKRKSK